MKATETSALGLPPVIAVGEADRAVRGEVDHAKAFRAAHHRAGPVTAADRAAVDNGDAIEADSFVVVEMARKDGADVVAGKTVGDYAAILADEIFGRRL